MSNRNKNRKGRRRIRRPEDIIREIDEMAELADFEEKPAEKEAEETAEAVETAEDITADEVEDIGETAEDTAEEDAEETVEETAKGTAEDAEETPEEISEDAEETDEASVHPVPFILHHPGDCLYGSAPVCACCFLDLHSPGKRQGLQRHQAFPFPRR